MKMKHGRYAACGQIVPDKAWSDKQVCIRLSTGGTTNCLRACLSFQHTFHYIYPPAYIRFIYKSSHAFSSAYHCFCGPPLWPIPSLMSASESTNQSRWSVLHGTVESIILLCSFFAPSYLENLVTVRPHCCYDKRTEFHFSTDMEITRDANCEQTERVWILIYNSRFNKHPAVIWCGCYKYKYTGSIVFLLFMNEDSFNNAL